MLCYSHMMNVMPTYSQPEVDKMGLSALMHLNSFVESLHHYGAMIDPIVPYPAVQKLR